jgi:hypothetical protein
MPFTIADIKLVITLLKALKPVYFPVAELGFKMMSNDLMIPLMAARDYAHYTKYGGRA